MGLRGRGLVHRSHGTRGEVAPFLCAGGPQRIFQPEPQAPGVSGGWEPHGVGTATVADSSLDPGSTPQVPDVGGSGCFNYIYIYSYTALPCTVYRELASGQR